MELRQAGEWRVIRSLRKQFSGTHPSIPIGIGDDAALIKPSQGKQILMTTDLFVEGMDFDLRWSSFRQIGHKAMAANLSDIAAMGGIPRFTLVAVALPQQTQIKSVDLLYKGLMDLGQEFNVRLIGGDTSASPRWIMITVCLMGEVEPRLARSRRGSRVGDRLFVTGTLGDSNAGLEILKRGKSAAGLRSTHSHLIQKHLYPRPRVREGRLLATRGLATSMIDISDGLSGDLQHLCNASGVGARIDTHHLPISSTLSAYAKKKRRDPLHYALEGGEDFELLFTVRPSRLKEMDRLRTSGSLKARMIGEITPKQRGITLSDTLQGERKLTVTGYEHFMSGSGKFPLR